METTRPEQSATAPVLFRTWGFWALMAGSLALILVFMGIALPMMEPKPSAGVQLGEIAGEIKRSAWRSFFGLERKASDVQPVANSVYLAAAAPILGILAIALSAISAAYREPLRLSAYAAGLGATAIAFQFIWWLAALLVCAFIIAAIIENIGDIFSF